MSSPWRNLAANIAVSKRDREGKMNRPIDYAAAPVAVRADLTEAHRRAWDRLAAPGTWWDARMRLAIAAEARNAPACALCRARRQALSPSAVAGRHDTQGGLAPALVEVVHRIRTDPGRLTRAVYASALAAGIAEGEYVETVGIIATVIAVDGFTAALGMPLHPLPEPMAGAPSRRRPGGARSNLAWVPTVAPEDVGEDAAGLYDGLGGAYIHRALSLVPAEVRGFFDLDAAQYLPDAALRDFGREYRHLSHAQIELLAARVSAINQCVY
jgi:alkylhydroperoxidase family enzyme